MNPLSVGCPLCKCERGKLCRRLVAGSLVLTQIHAERFKVAEEYRNQLAREGRIPIGPPGHRVTAK